MNPRNFLKLARPRIRGRKSRSFNLNNFRIKSIGIISFFSLWRPEKNIIMVNFWYCNYDYFNLDIGPSVLKGIAKEP
jgi:hypothetical protein